MKKFLLSLLLVITFTFSYSENNYIARIAVDENGNVLEGENIQLQHPLASVTKIMNALVVVDLIRTGDVDFDDEVTISRKAAAVGGSRISLRTGEKITLKDLLTATLVYSANNAAYAMAEYIAQTEDDFVRLMNLKAEKIGLNHTEYHTSTGLPSNMTGKGMDISSAYDIAKLSVYVLDYPEILEISSLPKTYIKNGTMRIFNRNKLLSEIKGIDGLKTGHHDSAGYNITVTAERDDLRIVTVILGASSEKTRDKEAEKLIDYVYGNFEKKKIISQGDFVIDVKVDGGKSRKVKLYASRDIEVIINKNWKLDKTVYLPDNIFAPILTQQKLGVYSVTHENQDIGKIELITHNAMKKGNWIDEIKKRFYDAGEFELNLENE